MKVINLKTDSALDHLVTDWIQKMEDVHHRCISTHLIDEKTEDEFIDIYDPQTDRCLTVWSSPARHGNDALKLAHSILKTDLING